MIELLLAADTSPDLVGVDDSVIFFPEVPESGGNYIGAVGHLISALMQTSGLMAQSEVLSTFSGFITSVGALVFVYALIVGIVSVALYGNYKQALYLIVGPALFYWMLSSTVPVSSTMVRYGDRVTQDSALNQRQFLALVSDLGVRSSGTEISWAFALWDNIVTEVVQRTVSVFLDTENLADLKQAATERVFSKVLRHRSSDPGFIRLLSTGVLGECAEQTMLAQEIASGGSAAEIARMQSRLQFLQQRRLSLDFSVQEYLRNLNPSSTALSTCPNASNTFAQVVAPSGGVTVVSCEQIWSLTCLAGMNEAEVAMRAAGGTMEDGVPWADVQAKVQSALTSGGSEEQATRILAAYIVRNTLGQTNHGALTSSIGRKAQFRKHEFNVIYGAVADSEAKGQRLGLIFFASMVPYVQGLLLFLLAAVFPFFCPFLLLPDRWTVFFVWMSLWLWVKCWDIGFACVHFIKLWLWEFMQGGIVADTVDWSQPDSVFRVIYGEDPLATTNTYFGIVSLLTVSVPFITAQFATGARHLYKAFGNALEQPTQQFAQRYGVNRRVQDVWSSAETASTQKRDEYALQETMKMYPGFDWQSFLGDGSSMMDSTVPRNIKAAYALHQAAYMYDGKNNNEWVKNLVTTAAAYTRIDPWNLNSGQATEGTRKLIERAHQLGIGREYMDLLGLDANSPAMTFGAAGGSRPGRTSDETGR